MLAGGPRDRGPADLARPGRGIYPRCWRTGGWPRRWRRTHQGALPVEVEADGVGRYAPEVEAAVYFCVLEGLRTSEKIRRRQPGHGRLW